MDFSYLAIQIALVTGLTEVIKIALLQEVHYKLVPLIALILGVTGSVLLFQSGTLEQSLIDGLIVGLSSVGLFTTVKSTAHKK